MIGAEVTVSRALALVTEPAALLTTTENWTPLSADGGRGGIGGGGGAGDVGSVPAPLVGERRRAGDGHGEGGRLAHFTVGLAGWVVMAGG